jgi:hypothetical protein
MTNVKSCDPDHAEVQVTIKLLDEWLLGVKNTVKQLKAEIEAKDEIISTLSRKIEQLEEKVMTNDSSIPTTSQPSEEFISQIATQIAKTSTKLNNAIVKATKNNEVLTVKKAKNVVVVGLPNSTKTSSEEKKKDDENLVNDLIHTLKRNAKINNTYRLKSRNSESKETNSDPLVVEFESVEARNDILVAAKDLADAPAYEKVYIRPDRTPAEQQEFSELNKERNKANEDLKSHNLLDQPFRFVIRSGRLRCIKVTEKTTVRNRQVHPFVSQQVANDARKGKVSNSSSN